MSAVIECFMWVKCINALLGMLPSTTLSTTHRRESNTDELIGLSEEDDADELFGTKCNPNAGESNADELIGTKCNPNAVSSHQSFAATFEALYNLKPKELKKCQRRICIEKIVSITTSTCSDEFAIHIPDEYDYTYKSEKHKRITGKHIIIKKVNTESTEKYIVPKNVARVLTREQRLKRYRELIGKDTYEDEINDINNCKFSAVKVIGRGSFGKVMQVKKKDEDKIYAMKILKKKKQSLIKIK
eukprot:928223_1